MAWLSLVIVTLIFFTPEIGIGPSIAAENVSIPVKFPFLEVAFLVPFTGPLRLFGYSAGLWLILWLIPWMLERALKTDFLAKFPVLRNDLVNSYRPFVSDKLAVNLAGLFLGLVTSKSILTVLLQVVIERFIPWLAGRVTVEVLSIITDLATQGLAGLLNLTSKNGVSFFVLSVLILIANHAYNFEKQNRYLWDISQNQNLRKMKQNNIGMSKPILNEDL